MSQMILEKALAADGDKWMIHVSGDTTWTIGTFVGAAINIVSVVAGVIAFSYLIYSGFLYLTAGGNGDASKKGGQGVINAIIGIAIISLSYAIFRAIEAFINK